MKLGATRVINAKDKDVLKEVAAFTNGAGIPKVFETAGSPVTIRPAVLLLIQRIFKCFCRNGIGVPVEKQNRNFMRNVRTSSCRKIISAIS
mgnify:CR=1 FL=1